MRLIELFEKLLATTELYHAMDREKADDVFHHDSMPARWMHKIDGKETKGNSFSRNSRLWFSNMKVVRLTVDRQKLQAKNKIIPLDGEYTFRTTQGYKPLRDRKFNKNEQVMAEEYVVGDIKNLHTVVKSVEIRFTPGQAMRNLLELTTAWCKRYGIPLKVDPEFAEEEKKERERASLDDD